MHTYTMLSRNDNTPVSSATWQTLLIPFLLLLGTIGIAWLSTRVVQPEPELAAGDEAIQHYLVNFYGAESNAHDTFCWSGARAAFALDGFWGRQVILDLRMASPRPPTAPVARTGLENNLWQSGDFVVRSEWRRYQVIAPVPPNHKQRVGLEVVRFSPDTHDQRTLGVALSHLHVRLPLQAGRPLIAPHMLLALPLPPLFYLLVYWSARRLWKSPPRRNNGNNGAITVALAAALATVPLVTSITLFPLWGVVPLFLLWLSLAVVGGLHILPPLLVHLWLIILAVGEVLMHSLAWLWRWLNSGRAPVLLPWTRTDYALAVGAGVLALLVRVFVLPTMLWQLIGDDYLVGAFAVNILDGYHQLYYDETGTLGSYMLAPVLATAGTSFETLMVLPIMMTTILTITLYGIGRDMLGRWGGIAAAAWMIMPSAYAMHWTFKLQPGYLEAVTPATLALWGTIRLIYQDQDRSHKTQVALMAAIAALCGLGLWSGLVTISIVFTCGIIVMLNWRRALRLPLAGYLLALSIGVGIFLFLILPAHSHARHDPMRVEFSLERLSYFTMRLGPEFVGIKRLWGYEPVAPLVGAVIVGVLALALVSVVYQAVYRRSHAAMVVLVLIAAAFGAALGSNFYEGKRYYFPLYIAVPLACAVLAHTAVRQSYGKAVWAPLCIAAFVLTNTISSLGNVDLSTRYVRLEPTLTRVLEQHDIRYVYASYPTAMGVLFESGGDIIPSSRVGPQRTSFDPRNEQRVRAAGGEDTAFVFLVRGMSTPTFEAYLDAHDIRCQRIVVVNHFIIYNHCTPFPDIEQLRETLPHGPDPADRHRVTADEVRTWEQEYNAQAR
jgi:hypothetical protein